MILFCARSNVCSCHRFYTKKPILRVDYNEHFSQLDIRFDPQPGEPHEYPMDFWNFEKLFPLLEVKKGTCSCFNVTVSNSETVKPSYTITLVEKEVKL